ncbi:hypothetical protein GGX14DRAFT_154190 [Mycena pura]|uniref:Uncharacterized protein n=1 Tax=Mycena pura TaxID=153505 RepID=A0AAD6Y5J5_9AGAR|nr:hypothetical protein GGX14DRAFT_154190 [Mycena pura]
MSQPESTSSRISKTGQSVASAAISTFHALNDAEPRYIPGAPYSTIRHTRFWVYYQGTTTTVPMSILGRSPLPADCTVSLQRRGWRTGLFGWTVGGLLGGTIGKEIDVTPAATERWADLEAKRQRQYDEEIRAFLSSAGERVPQDHRALALGLVHIPVAAGDGYFRLLVKGSKKQGVLAETAVFRVGSLSLRSAHPRGASLVTLVPELVLKSASVTLTTAAWASFYVAFPFLKVAQVIPGTSAWGSWALRRAYTLAGGNQKTAELKEHYRVEERRMRAEEALYRNVPFGSLGVRTAYDLEADAEMGKGGILFLRDSEQNNM